jgi:hypothetical protein
LLVKLLVLTHLSPIEVMASHVDLQLLVIHDPADQLADF